MAASAATVDTKMDDSTTASAAETTAAAAASDNDGGAAAAVDELSTSLSLNASLLPLLLRSGPFSYPDFEPGADSVRVLTEASRVLVVGAGGLGCELLKGLCLSGFRELHVIDMDTIDVSNLNRQFLFRLPDCGKYKAEVAAAFIRARCPGVVVHAYTQSIQSLGASWYAQFDCVIAGLDNVEARSWLNHTLVHLVQFDPETGEVDPSTVVPLIDGGTEGFSGQARVFLPRITSCFECSLASMPPQTGYAVCTIRNVPRLPEHCIAYALKVLWPRLERFASCTDYHLRPSEADGAAENSNTDAAAANSVKLDKDDVEHMTWLYERARERGAQFGIVGVTYALTMAVVKNIIPAIASTNALIAAACVTEALKYRSRAAFNLNNYFMYAGGQPTGTNTETLEYQRNERCAVCHPPHVLRCSPSRTLRELLEQAESECRLQQASLCTSSGTELYLSALKHTHANLDKYVGELLEAGQIIIANDKSRRTQKLLLLFADE